MDAASSVREIRLSSGSTQAAFAKLMGVPVRTLQDIESGKSKTRPIHIRAAERAAELVVTAPSKTASEAISYARQELLGAFRYAVPDEKILVSEHGEGFTLSFPYRFENIEIGVSVR